MSSHSLVPPPHDRPTPPASDLARGLFCNRTLNLRSIRAIGYDMDYTLIHYKVEEWEKRAYELLIEHFARLGWPVEHLRFDPMQVARGLVIDQELGNLVKANRFGFVKRAVHGTRPLDFEVQRTEYARTIVDLSEPRWVFLNTLFSLSEGCLYAQLVDLLDDKRLPETMGYSDLYRRVRDTMNFLHMEGRLKADIIAQPERFVVPEPEVPLALLDQKHAGKKLLLVTNSEWSYVVPMMSFAFDRFLPTGMTWRGLFDIIVVGARKPEFFTTDSPFFEVVTQEGLMAPTSGEILDGRVYLGGSARQLERHLKLSGDEILYVGDHMFGDVRVTKNVLRWRTALILRELEDDILAEEAFRPRQKRLDELMLEKERIEARMCQSRLSIQRIRDQYGPMVSAGSLPSGAASDEAALQQQHAELRAATETLDRELAPLARAATELNNPNWGLLMRAGNDKSHLAFQIERYADVYTSRVSNFLAATPFVYLRSPRGSLPHDAT